MITTEKQYFLRIILLLYDAASFILRHIVVRELEKHGDDLDNLLTKDEFNNKLRHKLHFGKSQVEKLFPSNGKSDIRTWDSQMLAVVSLLIFRSTLSSDERVYINCIKHARNRVAHKASASYFEDDFIDERDVIVKAINILASSFDSTVQEKCGELISSCCSDHLDDQLAIEHLKEDITNNELLSQILDAVNQKHEIVCNDIKGHAERIENNINLTEKKICESQETVLNSLNELCLDVGNVESKVTESKEKHSQELKQVNASLTHHIVNETEKLSQKVDSNNSFLLQELQKTQNEHAVKLESKLEELKKLFEQTARNSDHCTKQIKFGTHTHLTVDGPTQEWINTVETVLKSVFDLLLNKVQEPGQNPETERAVEEFLNFIKGFKGVELKAVERKCISLAFECRTYESLRDLIAFINSRRFHNYLDSIARALENDLKITRELVISSEIPVDSLQLVVDYTCSSIKTDSKKGIALSFECTSIAGLDTFWRLFVKGEATPYIDNIAATVSSEAREKTCLSTSVNLHEFEDALKHLEATVNKQIEKELLKPKSQQKQQSSDSESLDSELDIDKMETRTDKKAQDSCVKERYPAKDHETTIPNIQRQDELTPPDPFHPVYTSVEDTSPSIELIDLPPGDTEPTFSETSLISGLNFRRFPMRDLAEPSKSGQSRFKQPKFLHETESAGTRYGSEQQLRKLPQEAKLSHSHHLNRLSLVHQKDIHVDCGITIESCAILSHERLVIADDEGLYVVNISTRLVEKKNTLNKSLSDIADIAVLPNDQIAVTLPFDDTILILSTNDFSLISSIPALNRPSGITYNRDELYVVCLPNGKDPSVNILNLQGGLRREITCFEILYCTNAKIAVCMDAQNMYITDYSGLIRYSTQGQVIARYRFEKDYLKALTLLDDGSLLVISDTIHHISTDLQQGYELKLDKGDVRFVGVDPVNNLIYAIFFGNITVYYIQNQDSQWQSYKKRKTDKKFENELMFQSFETDDDSLETDDELDSFKDEIMFGFLPTKAEMEKYSLETDEELPICKAGPRFSSNETEEVLPLFKVLKLEQLFLLMRYDFYYDWRNEIFFNENDKSNLLFKLMRS